MKWIGFIAILFFSIQSERCSWTKKNEIRENYQVLVFLSPACPICQQVTPSLRQVYEFIVTNEDFSMEFVFTKETNKIEIDSFMNYYQLNNVKYSMDDKKKKSKKVGAKITPECFIIKNKTRLYQGKVDDLYQAIGIKKNKKEINYLLENCKALANEKKIKYHNNKAVGCFIQ